MLATIADDLIPQYPWTAVPRYRAWFIMICPGCGRLFVTVRMDGRYPEYTGDCPCGVTFSRSIW